MMEDDPLIGTLLGPFQVIKEIGRGGMGAVYLAKRVDGSFRQRVAIKIVKRGMDTDFILRRFRRERQIIAGLNHPHIASLLDGGSTGDGLPYFVMEYIEGQSLYLHCDGRRLSVPERLKIFRNLCHAVDYAHRNQVIHRDLKPSNVLVKNDGTPKLLDFGIAKVLNSDFTADSIDPTTAHMRLMTPEYASPEHLRGELPAPASDVYSLGVMLYELVTGHRPYRLRSLAPHEMARVICEEDPELPSSGLTREDSLVSTGAVTTTDHIYRARSSSSLEALRHEIAGDLERVIMKTLRKDPSERYESAAELAEDITRYLQGKRVLAPAYLPESAAYGLIQRPANPSTIKSLAVLPLTVLNLGRQGETDDQYLSVGLADAMIARLSGVRSFTVRPTSAILRYGGSATDPVSAGRELGVDFVIDGRIKISAPRLRVSLQLLDVQSSTSVWANQFDEQYTDVLDLEDSISLKVVEAILPLFTERERPNLKKRGTDNPSAFEAYMRGRFHWNQFTPESLPKALEAFQQAIVLDPDYALAHVGLVDYYLWANIYGILPSSETYPVAEAAATEALKLDDRLGEAYAVLALIRENQWKFSEAEGLYHRALELNPNDSHVHEWYSSLLVGTGRFAEGLKESLRAEKLDPLSLRTKTLTAWTFYQANHYAEAFAKAQQIIDLDRNYPQGYIQLGNSLTELGRAEEAIAALRHGIKLMPDSALPKYILCFALERAGRHKEAREVLHELENASSRFYVKPYFLAMAYTALNERDLAYRHFAEAFAERDPWVIWFGTDPKLLSLRQDPRFVELYNQTGNPLAAGINSGRVTY